MTDDPMQDGRGGSKRSRALAMGVLVATGLTVAVAGLAPTAAAQSDASQTKTYVAGAGATWLAAPEDPRLLFSDDCCHCITQTFIGGAAFCQEADHTEITVSIDDATGLPTAGLVQIGESEELHAFCGETTIATEDAEDVFVFAGDAVMNAGVDPGCPHQGTTGEVTVAWN